jgi:hypothetical protein
VRIHRPALIELANIHPDYVNLLASVADSVDTVTATVKAVERGLASPEIRSAERSAVARDLFHGRGGATARSVEAIYDVIELDPAAASAEIQQAAEPGLRGSPCPQR